MMLDHDPADATTTDEVDVWPSYRATAHCSQELDDGWWIDVHTRWTDEELVSGFFPGKEFSAPAANAKLGDLGWAPKGPWIRRRDDHHTCTVIAMTPRPLEDEQRKARLEEELNLLEASTRELRHQLAILNTTPTQSETH